MQPSTTRRRKKKIFSYCYRVYYFFSSVYIQGSFFFNFKRLIPHFLFPGVSIKVKFMNYYSFLFIIPKLSFDSYFHSLLILDVLFHLWCAFSALIRNFVFFSELMFIYSFVYYLIHSLIFDDLISLLHFRLSFVVYFLYCRIIVSSNCSYSLLMKRLLILIFLFTFLFVISISFIYNLIKFWQSFTFCLYFLLFCYMKLLRIRLYYYFFKFCLFIAFICPCILHCFMSLYAVNLFYHFQDWSIDLLNSFLFWEFSILSIFHLCWIINTLFYRFCIFSHIYDLSILLFFKVFNIDCLFIF